MDPQTQSALETTVNILAEMEQDEAERRLPPTGSWPSVLHSWERRESMPEWHALYTCRVYNCRFTISAEREFTVFAEVTTEPVRKADGRLRMECIIAGQILRLAGVTKEAFGTSTDKDLMLEAALDQCKVTPLRIRGKRSQTEGEPLNGQPRRKPKWWINEITKG